MLGGVFLGIFSGMLSGYIPGLHPNTFFSEFDPTYLDREDVLTFASACSAVNVPLSKVESMFLGVPDDQTSVAVLIPLQRYTIEGRAEEAARLVALGTLSTGFFAAVTLPCIVKIVGPMYVISKPIIPWLVLAILVLQTYDNGLRGLAIFSASSVLGYVVLSGPLDVASPLEAMFSGFYAIGPGISCLINRTSIPKQRPGKPAILGKELPKCGILAAFAGCTLGFLPGLGPANVVSVLTRLGVDTTERYLLVTSGIDAADAVSSIVALHALGNPRSGASVFIQRSVGDITYPEVLASVGVYLLVSVLGVWLLIFSTRVLGEMLSRARARVLTGTVVIGLLALMTSHGLGSLGTAIVCAGIGIYALRSGVDPSLCTSALALPTVLKLLGVG
ncbi:tripartite tricarboxylate transporter permease [Methanopyrus sp.]